MRARLGQHFLTSPAAARRIVEAARPARGEEVVEIGAGRGRLTELLLEAGARVTAVELDERLAGKLGLRFAAWGEALRVVRADFLKVEAARLPPRPKFVANLPYAVASPILQRILRWPGPEAGLPGPEADGPGWRLAVLMFQREVAQRILAAPGDAGYGLLSVSVRLRARASWVTAVGREHFTPKPRVESAVVKLEPLERPFPPREEEAALVAARAAFRHRRKTAANSIALELGIPRAEAEAALARAGVAPGERAERIAPEAFAALGAALCPSAAGSRSSPPRRPASSPG